jgi:hypothetical protein
MRYWISSWRISIKIRVLSISQYTALLRYMQQSGGMHMMKTALEKPEDTISRASGPARRYALGRVARASDRLSSSVPIQTSSGIRLRRKAHSSIR